LKKDEPPIEFVVDFNFECFEALKFVSDPASLMKAYKANFWEKHKNKF
jgi:hypothetical protein